MAWLLEQARPFAGRLGLDEPELRADLGTAYDRSHDIRSAANHWSAVGDGSDPDALPADVRGIAVPTLVVHGTDDPLFPLPHGKALAAAVPGARLLVVDGMGHQVPPRSTWEQVLPAIGELTHRPPVEAPPTLGP